MGKTTGGKSKAPSEAGEGQVDIHGNPRPIEAVETDGPKAYAQMDGRKYGWEFPTPDYHSFDDMEAPNEETPSDTKPSTHTKKGRGESPPPLESLLPPNDPEANELDEFFAKHRGNPAAEEFLPPHLKLRLEAERAKEAEEQGQLDEWLEGGGGEEEDEEGEDVLEAVDTEAAIQVAPGVPEDGREASLEGDQTVREEEPRGPGGWPARLDQDDHIPESKPKPRRGVEKPRKWNGRGGLVGWIPLNWTSR